ncbi:hypothetical protein M0802_004482 [Mischocyttarus mexicanus]|nr:hypothetical protein M0802_004482 [Mischocyttarus mexicanus]
MHRGRPEDAVAAQHHQARPWAPKLRDFSRRWIVSLRSLYGENAASSITTIRNLMGNLQSDGKKKGKKIKDNVNVTYPNIDNPEFPEIIKIRKSSKSLDDVTCNYDIGKIGTQHYYKSSIEKLQTPAKRQAPKPPVTTTTTEEVIKTTPNVKSKLKSQDRDESLSNITISTSHDVENKKIDETTPNRTSIIINGTTTTTIEQIIGTNTTPVSITNPSSTLLVTDSWRLANKGLLVAEISAPLSQESSSDSVFTDTEEVPLPLDNQCIPITPSSTDTLIASSITLRDDYSEKRSPFSVLRHKKIQLPPTPSQLNISPSPACNIKKTPHRRHTMYETSPESQVLRRVANLVLDRASLESKITDNAKVVPRKLDYGLYSKFEGLRLIEALTSELPEHLKSQLTDAEREKLELAFYSRLVSTGLLRSLPDKDSTNNIPQTVTSSNYRNQFENSTPLHQPQTQQQQPSSSYFTETLKKSKTNEEVQRLEKELIELRKEIERLKKLNKDAVTMAQDKCVQTSPKSLSPSVTSASSPSSNDYKSASQATSISEGEKITVVSLENSPILHNKSILSDKSNKSKEEGEGEGEGEGKEEEEEEEPEITNLRLLLEDEKSNVRMSIDKKSLSPTNEEDDINNSQDNNLFRNEENGEIVTEIFETRTPAESLIPVVKTIDETRNLVIREAEEDISPRCSPLPIPPPPPPLPPSLLPSQSSLPPLISIATESSIHSQSSRVPALLASFGPPPPPMPGMTGPPPPPPLFSTSITGAGPGSNASGPPPPPPPPFASTPTPLPAPPIGGWNPPSRSTLRKQPLNPVVPMKPLYWTRIIAPVTAPSIGKSTVSFWAELEEEKDLDISEFTSLFSRQVTERKLAKKGENVIKKPSKIQPAKILDSKRSKTVGILEKSLHIDFTEVENAVYNLDTSVIGLESLQQIYEVRATQKELDEILAHEKTNSEVPLDRPELFLKRLAGIDHFSERMACLVFQSEFQDAISSVSSKLTNLKTICEYLNNSNSLKKVMALILTLGNYMNGGNMMRGQADGFHLEILDKLKDVKSKVPGITLLHFIVKARLAQEKDCNFDEPLPLPVPEPADIKAASNINFDDITKELQRLNEQLKACQQKYDAVIESDPPNARVFRENMNTFFTSATTELENENKALVKARKKFKTVMQFYQFVPKGATLDTADPNQFFSLWFNFCHDFKDIWKKEQQRLKKEKNGTRNLEEIGE